jgi:hypothetical protein
MSLVTVTEEWDLASGPVYALAGASGFGSPDPEHWWRSPVQLDGSFHQGLRIPAREVSLPVEVSGRTNDEWLAVDRRFWRGMDPRETVGLVVTTPDARSRWLTMRLVNGGDVEHEIDPMLNKQAVYPLTFLAGDPYWRGEHIEQVYGAEVGATNMFPGPPFSIGTTKTITSGNVTNPGDIPAWPRWVINGPYTSATVGVGSAQVTLSTAIGAGATREINMDPRYNSIRKGNGDDAWLEATNAVFEPIPPGVDVPLSMSVVGDSPDTSVELHFDAKYRRAW